MSLLRFSVLFVSRPGKTVEAVALGVTGEKRECRQMPRPQVWKIGDPKKLLLAVCLETLLDVTTVFSGANFLPTFPRWQIIIRGLRKGYENDGIGGLSQIRLGMSRSWRKITRTKKKKEKGVPDVPLEVLFRACYSVMPRLNCFP